eukprot:550781_1
MANNNTVNPNINPTNNCTITPAINPTINLNLPSNNTSNANHERTKKIHTDRVTKFAHKYKLTETEKDKLLNSKSITASRMMNQIKSNQRNRHNPDNQTFDPRKSWKCGDLIEVYSVSKGRWCLGMIKSISNEDADLLNVEYKTSASGSPRRIRSKTMRRHSHDIRVHCDAKNTTRDNHLVRDGSRSHYIGGGKKKAGSGRDKKAWSGSVTKKARSCNRYGIDRHIERKQTHPEQWNESEVATWLGTLDCGKYARYKKTFIENEVDGEELFLLDANVLARQQYGIKKVGHQRGIAQAIRTDIELYVE